MHQIIYYLRSLLVTAIISSLLPLVAIGSVYLSLMGVQQLGFGEYGRLQLHHFLSVFGSGNPWHGMLLIALASGTVGVLFDSFTLYRYQSFGHH